MKAASLTLFFGGWLAALDPNGGNGCGAAAGANDANGSVAPDAATPAAPIDTTGVPLVDCGPLGRHAFCDDFAGAMPGKFERQEVVNGLVTLDGVLVASTEKPASGTRAIAQLKKDLVAEGERFSLSFTENVEAACFVGKNAVQSNGIVVNGGKFGVALSHGDDGDSVVESNLEGGIYVQAHELRAPVPHDKTVKVTLDLDLVAKTVSLDVDGTRVMDREPLKYPPSTRQKPTVVAGLLVDNLLGPTPCKARIDDVTFDVQLAR